MGTTESTENKKVIIFDFDDTLVKTRDCKWAAIKQTARRCYGLDVSDKDIRKFWGMPFEEMLTGVMQGVDTFASLRSKYTEISKEFPMQAYPNSVEVVVKLIASKLVGVLTASAKQLVMEDLSLLKFPVDRFFAIYASEDTEFHKPDPRVFNSVLSDLEMKYGLVASDVLYVGDTVNDFLAAQGAGLDFIGLLHDEAQRVKFEENKVRYIHKIQELEQELLGL